MKTWVIVLQDGKVVPKEVTVRPQQDFAVYQETSREFVLDGFFASEPDARAAAKAWEEEREKEGGTP